MATQQKQSTDENLPERSRCIEGADKLEQSWQKKQLFKL